MTSLRRVCPIMPENELEKLVTRVALAEEYARGKRNGICRSFARAVLERAELPND